MQKFVTLVLGAWCFLAAGCVQRVLESLPAPSVPAEVPPVYRDIYRELGAEIDRQLRPVSFFKEKKKARTLFGVELPLANSRHGETLWNEPVADVTALTLDRLQALSIQAVSIGLPYPVLTRSHPRIENDREFFRRIAVEIRRRGLAIIVEIGAPPGESEPNQVEQDYHGIKREKFREDLREMAETVIADIRPEFLTLLSEPDTQTRNTGLSFSPTEFAAIVRRVATGLDRSGTKLGAGAGSWASIDYFKALANIPELHYIDFHIFPVQYGYAAERILKASEAARAKGKQVAIGAAWLYKTSGREFSQISRSEALARNTFSFWQPLDENFIRLVTHLAGTIEAEFCAFFGTKYLYAYVEHTGETSRQSPGQLFKLSEQLAKENLFRGRLSPTGERFKGVIVK